MRSKLIVLLIGMLFCIFIHTTYVQAESDESIVEVPPLIYEIIDSVEAEQPLPLYSSSINILEKLLSEDPTNIQVRLSLASSYEKSFVFSKALDHYLKAAEQAPDKADPFIGLGRLYYTLAILDMGNRNLTSTSTTGLIVFHPDEKTKKVLLSAKEMFLISKEKEPIGFFSPDTADEFLVMIGSKLIMPIAEAEEWVTEGDNLIKKGKYKEAIDALNKAIEIDSYCALAYYNRAVAYFYLKRYNKTIEDCKEVIEIAPPGSEVHIEATYLQELARKRLLEQSPTPTLIPAQTKTPVIPEPIKPIQTPLITPKITPTPRFEAVFVIAVLLAVAYILRRRR